MPLGHRGANHPVKNLITNKVEITSQNHGFEVDLKSIPKEVKVTHKSLFDGSIEGVEVKEKKLFYTGLLKIANALNCPMHGYHVKICFQIIRSHLTRLQQF